MYNTIPELTPETIARFWNNVEIKGANDCWNWKSTCNYGRFRINSKCYYAHRIALATIGLKSDVLMVLHDPLKCNNPRCVNPNHLRLGTSLQNGRDKITVGNLQGSKNSQATLLESDIPIIRLLANTMSNVKIAKLFNIGPCAISQIKRHITWKHVIGVATDAEVAEFLRTGTSVPFVLDFQI
jgi:hypothetical protein